MALLGIELDGVEHALVYNLRVEGTSDIVSNSEFVGLLNELGGIFTGNHDNRNILNPLLFIHNGKNFKAVHLRHIDVEQD